MLYTLMEGGEIFIRKYRYNFNKLIESTFDQSVIVICNGTKQN